MALNKITYEDKVSLNPQPSIANINKVSDADMNEIKSVVNAGIDNLNNDYTDVSTQITKNRPSDLEIYSAYAKKIGSLTILDIIFKTSTGFEAGGSAEPIATLPTSLRPTQAIRSTCWLSGSYDYPGWDGITGNNDGAIMGWLYITTYGTIYVRFPNVSGQTRKSAQIHIVF